MKNKGKKLTIFGVIMLAIFALWTYLIQTVDVQPVGQKGTDIGFADLNVRFHEITGVHMSIYTITDWLGLVPIAVCMGFGLLGMTQLIKRKSLLKVDVSIVLLGVYYILVIFGYLIFEMIPINYRPIPINGYMEASYPSSTTLLVLSVMPTLSFQAHCRASGRGLKLSADIFATGFSLFMVIGRTVSGVHWLTDIIGSMILSGGLYFLYHGAVLLTEKE
ncbi:MAG: phosphoesterase PA-phosphatase [Ruminococcus sp.]|uniref:phosphatase PAP2 family protein n=1 Tax=Ruminococcus sp. TaxID=41978 RepID=UPI0025EAC826|nr:phosphatase PAP2 family protein [Ruminococcus sp.]MBO4867097.1 phosphoesterase PA-phosphatase [Ruminococcus sp.]